MILLNWNHATCHQIWPRQGFVNWNNCILAFFCAGVMAWSSSTSPRPGGGVTSSFLTLGCSSFSSSCGCSSFTSSFIASLPGGLGAGLSGFEGMALAAGALLPLAEDDAIDRNDPIGAVAMGPIGLGGGGPGGAGGMDLPRWNLMLASGHTSLHRFRALSRLCSKSSSVQATPVKSSWRFWVRVRMFLSNTERPTSRWMSQLRQLNRLKTLQESIEAI